MIDFELECIGFHGMPWISDVSFFWDLMEFQLFFFSCVSIIFQCSFFFFQLGYDRFI